MIRDEPQIRKVKWKTCNHDWIKQKLYDAKMIDQFVKEKNWTKARPLFLFRYRCKKCKGYKVL